MWAIGLFVFLSGSVAAIVLAAAWIDTLSVNEIAAEIERKIGELRVIEGWLAMSLNFMQMSIKTMELQKASLEAIRGAKSAEIAKRLQVGQAPHPEVIHRDNLIIYH